MSLSDDILAAIGAHGRWKSHLRAIIASGVEPLTEKLAASASACEFGQWLAQLPLAARDSSFYTIVTSLHESFHKEAARVVSLATHGHTAEAVQCLEFGGRFASVSAELTTALMEWKKSLD